MLKELKVGLLAFWLLDVAKRGSECGLIFCEEKNVAAKQGGVSYRR